MTCPSALELSRARTLGVDPAIAAHLAGCAACRDHWDATTAAIDLARELPVAIPPAARREEVRTAVLAASATVAGPSTRRTWIAPAIAGAMAAGVLIYVAVPGGSPPARHAHGAVRPRAGAHYDTSWSGATEVVRLSDGVIDIEVEPLAAGERFLVVVGGAEIEVRGTVFSVAASARHLVDVVVSRGHVDVRPETGPSATLAAGQSWHVTAMPAPSPPVAAAAPRPTPAPPVRPVLLSPPAGAPPAPRAVDRRASAAPRMARPPAPSELAPSAPPPERTERSPAPAVDEVSYNQAWEALRANNFARAVSGFSRVILLAPDSALVEDATFWRAVALARGERRADARAAFQDFLDSYAASTRAGEASAMLGWILIDAGERDEAARRFHAAVGDARAAVRASAQAGLDALATPKPRR